MGLDINTLEINPFFRLWINSGLRYFLHSQADTILAHKYSDTAQKGFPASNLVCEKSRLREPWKSIWESAACPCRCIITYWELPQDLISTQGSSRERSLLFYNMLKALQWPQDQYVFWPVCCLQDSRFCIDLETFWSCLEQFRPTYLLCFGDKVSKTLYPDYTSNSSGFKNTYNTEVLFLPGPSDMLPDNRIAKNQVWRTLLKLEISSSR